MQMIVMSEGLLLNSKLMFSHTRRWYQFLSLNYFFCLFVCFLLLLLFYVILLLLIFAKIILLLSFYLIDYFFKKNYLYFFMFRHVPACSGMFRVPGFIDAHLKYGYALWKYWAVSMTSSKKATKLVSFGGHPRSRYKDSC